MQKDTKAPDSTEAKPEQPPAAQAGPHVTQEGVPAAATGAHLGQPQPPAHAGLLVAPWLRIGSLRGTVSRVAMEHLRMTALSRRWRHAFPPFQRHAPPHDARSFCHMFRQALSYIMAVCPSNLACRVRSML
jgi:hypothetical protein